MRRLTAASPSSATIFLQERWSDSCDTGFPTDYCVILEDFLYKDNETRHIGELFLDFIKSNNPLAQHIRQGILNGSITPLEDWLTGPVVEDMLNISTRTLQTLRDNGSLPYSKVGGKVYYKRRDVEQMLENGYNNNNNNLNNNKYGTNF